MEISKDLVGKYQPHDFDTMYLNKIKDEFSRLPNGAKNEGHKKHQKYVELKKEIDYIVKYVVTE